MDADLLRGHHQLAVGYMVKEAATLYRINADFTVLEVFQETNFQGEWNYDGNIFQILKNDIIFSRYFLGCHCLLAVCKIFQIKCSLIMLLIRLDHDTLGLFLLLDIFPSVAKGEFLLGHC